MSDFFRVEWELGSPFLSLVEGLTARAAQRWSGEPTEALGFVWIHLRDHFPIGEPVDPEDRLLRTIIYRKVSNFYRQDAVRHESLPQVEQSRTMSPPIEIIFRELLEATDGALTDMGPQQREAVLVRLSLGGAESMADLARSWGTSTQNARKHASEGRKRLQTSLARFDPRRLKEATR